jgi:glycosyltransferase involved in cell wall biosynthesis
MSNSHLSNRPTEQSLRRRVDDLEREVERLHWEIAGLATNLNTFYNLRLIRLFNKYRKLRNRLSGSLWRYRFGSNGPESSSKVDRDRLDKGLYDVVFLAIGDWRWRYQRPQHLVTRWSVRGHRVFYIVPNFAPAVNPKFHRKPSHQRYSISTIQDNVFEAYLGADWGLSPLNDRPTESDVVDLYVSIETIKRDFKIEAAIIIVELPFWASIAIKLKQEFGWFLVYDCVDRHYGVFPLAHAMLSEETRLAREADLVTATSRLIQKDMLKINPSVALIPNGVDIAHFSREQPAAVLDPIDFHHPTICYIGNLANRFNKRMVYEAAKRRSDWRFLLIGSGELRIDELNRLPNVLAIGEKPYSELPGYLQQSHVCIIPYRGLSWTAATNPVKFYEYMAAGKPVVATELPELQPYQDYFYLARNEDEFVAAIQQAINEDNLEKQASRRMFASQFSWDLRFDDLYQAIKNHLDVNDKDVHSSTESMDIDSDQSPWIDSIDPAAIKVYAIADRSWNGRLEIDGHGFSLDCRVLIDEEPVPTIYISENCVKADLSQLALDHSPGCKMISVVNQRSWEQSNRRLIMIKNC